MNVIKKAVSVIIVAVMILCLPAISFANEAGEYTVSLSGTIDGNNQANTSFGFKVVCSLLEESDEERIVVFEETIQYNTGDKINYGYNLKPEHVENGGYIYEFTMSSCSDAYVAVDSKTVTIYLLRDEYGESVIKAFDSSKEDSEMPEEEILEFPYNITFDCKTGSVVSVEMVNPEVTKVYDGTDVFTLNPEDYRLIGVSPQHEVLLEIGSVRFDSADVTTATKIILSDLTLSGADADKYILKSGTLEFPASITPRPITVTAKDITITKGSAVPALTYRLSEELLPGNEITGKLSCDVRDEAGRYTIGRGTLAISDNYEITFKEGRLVVTNFVFKTLTDDATSIKVSGYLAEKAKLIASVLSESGDAYKTLTAEVSGGKVIKGYNISIDGEHDGQLEVVIPVASKYEGKEITVYQNTSSNGVVSFSAVVKNSAVTINIYENATVLLVTEEAEPKNEFSVGRLLLIILLVLLGIILLVVLVAGVVFIYLIYTNKTAELRKIIKRFKRLINKK